MSILDVLTQLVQDELDRLLHRGHLLKFEGKSYRIKEASKKLAIEKKNN